MTMTHEVMILGGGVVGCALAEALSWYTADVALLEAAQDVAEGASKANSGIVHAGFDAKPGTQKARCNVRGAAMYPALCARLGVPYRRTGALVLAFSKEEMEALRALRARAGENGVEASLLDGREVRALEPNVNERVLGALRAPGSAVASPYELTCALADAAARRGAAFLRNTPALSLRHAGGLWRVDTPRGELACRAVVNCAGLGAAALHNQISPEPLTLIARRGEYYLLDHTLEAPFSHTMFQAPTRMGKGVLITQTAHGNVLLGPSAEDTGDPLDTATTREGLDFVLEKCRLTWPDASTREVITTFAGVRAHPAGDDFLVGPVPGAPPGAFEAAGIESPGLSAAPAIAQALCGQIARLLRLEKKKDPAPDEPLPPAFAAMTPGERAAAFARDPAYGRVVCRCETVTEAEVRAAIRRPVGARSIDGVKRRTRAGMGRCQGGFCSPRVLEILCEELGLSPLEVTKRGGASHVLCASLADMAKEARHDK